MTAQQIPYLAVSTPDGPVVHETEVRKSRFLCSLLRVEDEAEAQAFIASVRKEHWDARHNCTAFVIGDRPRRERSNDDAEPAGTAGAPMLEVLRRRGLTDTVAVVTRYFGGVLLGTGGLVRAYGGAVSAALDQVEVVERRLVALLAVSTDHQRAGRLENDLRAAGHLVREAVYTASGVRFEVGVPADRTQAFEAWLAAATAGAAQLEPIGTERGDVPWNGADPSR
ncbi:YigZ family protein [Streptacidiphilus carbonis]|uniref:YigZ family protein n=1 Tax=Streptacidiphilus carbonis TaxID=105422 RepID=UPI0005AA9683|nr:YigZ family protein [Streptacidiphilus carbonis]